MATEEMVAWDKLYQQWPNVHPTMSAASTLTALSAPEEANRDSGWPGPFAAIKEPAGAAGAQDTAVTPSGWAFGICAHLRESGTAVAEADRFHQACEDTHSQGVKVIALREEWGHLQRPPALPRLICQDRDGSI